MSWINKFGNDDPADEEAQESWGDRPWRWLPYGIQFPAATIGAAYREIKKSFVRKTHKSDTGQERYNQTPEETLKPSHDEKSVLGKEDLTLNKSLVMPTQKGKKKKKGKKKPRKATKKKTPVRKVQTRVKWQTARQEKPPRVVKARVNQEMMYPSGNRVTFRSGSKPGCLLISGRQNLGVLAMSAGSGPTYTQGIGLTSIGGSYVGQVFFNPANYFYFTSPYTTFGFLFQRYRMLTHSVEFITEVATSYSGSVTVATVDDPCAFQSTFVGTGYTGISQLPTAQIQQFTTAQTWPLYLPRKVVNLFPSTGWLYCAGPDYGTQYVPTDDAADQRMFYSGGLATVVENLNPPPAVGTQTILAKVYYNYTIELCDLSPGITHTVSLSKEINTRSFSSKRMDAMKQEMKRLFDSKFNSEEIEEEASDLASTTKVHYVTDDVAKTLPGYQALEIARELSGRSNSKERKTR